MNSFLDNAPNKVVGHIKQKRLQHWFKAFWIAFFVRFWPTILCLKNICSRASNSSGILMCELAVFTQKKWVKIWSNMHNTLPPRYATCFWNPEFFYKLVSYHKLLDLLWFVHEEYVRRSTSKFALFWNKKNQTFPFR